MITNTHQPILPVFVKADQAELDEIDFKIDAALKAAEEHELEGALWYAEVGRLFATRKAKMLPEQWPQYAVAKSKRSLRQVQRWIKLGECDPRIDLNKKWRIICGRD